MSSHFEPKVTECWAKEKWEAPEGFLGYPLLLCLSPVEASPNYRPAILIWREDYDAMRKELEELRRYKQAREADDAYRRECAERKHINKVWGLEEKWDGSKE